MKLYVNNHTIHDPAWEINKRNAEEIQKKLEELKKTVYKGKTEEDFLKLKIETTDYECKYVLIDSKLREDVICKDGIIINKEELKELLDTQYNLEDEKNNKITVENIDIDNLKSNYIYVRLLFENVRLKIEEKNEEDSITFNTSCLYRDPNYSHNKACGILVIIPLNENDINKQIIWNQKNYYIDSYIKIIDTLENTFYELDYSTIKEKHQYIAFDSLEDLTQLRNDVIREDGIVVNNKEELKDLLESRYSFFDEKKNKITINNINVELLNSDIIYVKYIERNVKTFKIEKIDEKNKITFNSACLYDVPKIVKQSNQIEESTLISSRMSFRDIEGTDLLRDNYCGTLVFIPLEVTDLNKQIIWNQKNYYTAYYNKIYSRYEDNTLAKPVIYIYPEQEMELEIKLGKEENITCIYPEYNGYWKVLAKPDGTLVNQETGREYYCLYYESLNIKKYTNQDLQEGFVVSKDEIIDFLEDKLAFLGLNDKETEEFIIYWLPKLQASKYVYIRFQDEEEIENNMPLEFSKEPDTLIRIVMEWKGLNSPISIHEQSLEKVNREGFTIVEWGGIEITK